MTRFIQQKCFYLTFAFIITIGVVYDRVYIGGT